MAKPPTSAGRNPAIGRKQTKTVDISLWEKRVYEEKAERERSRLETLTRTSGHLADYLKIKKVWMNIT
jgi:hypothetical protein